MRSHPVGLDVWFCVGPFVYFHTSCVRTAKALHPRSLAWAFAGRLCDKYHNLMSWLIIDASLLFRTITKVHLLVISNLTVIQPSNGVAFMSYLDVPTFYGSSVTSKSLLFFGYFAKPVPCTIDTIDRDRRHFVPIILFTDLLAKCKYWKFLRVCDKAKLVIKCRQI